MKSRLITSSLIAAVLVTLSITSTAEAARFASRANFESKSKTLQESPSDSGVAVIDEGCCAKLPKCCYDPCISYRYRGCRCVCCGCEQPTKAILKVTDCQCCCFVNVPICVPPCCKGKPCVKSHCGFFGRSVAEYRWCCGFKVRVVITKCKDVIVTYHGL